MKSREVLVRLHRFRVEEIQRRLASLHEMRSDLARKSSDLEQMVQDEQKRAAVNDLGRLAYPSFARSVVARRENIQRSIDEVQRQADAVTLELESAFQDLKKHEIEAENAAARERANDARRQQNAADDAAGLAHLRNKSEALS